jgi:hypothetical protein
LRVAIRAEGIEDGAGAAAGGAEVEQAAEGSQVVLIEAGAAVVQELAEVAEGLPAALALRELGD